MRNTKRLYVHDEANDLTVGDRVRVVRDPSTVEE
jgi:ribosomal protein S17